MSYTPKIIFVDGFNASGKDYAVARITEELTTRGYTPLMGDPRYFLPKVIASKRYYTFKMFDKINIEAITNGHINALKDYVDKLQQADDTAVVVVNRSYMSTLMYNHVITADVSEADFEDRVAFYAEEAMRYVEAHREILAAIPAVKFVISKHYDKPDATPDESIELLKAKITKRDGTTHFDDVYLKYLTHGYTQSSAVFDMVSTPTTHGHSGQTKEFVDAYFPPLHTTHT